jgi:uncharacterized protein (DUF58 family)
VSTLTAAAVVRRGALLRELELSIGHKLDGLLHGDHQGALPGPGTEAGDGRAYQPGDDVRRIDWNLTARSGEVHVRDTIAERELETWFVVDGTASLDYGTADSEKRDLATAVVAAFGLLTARPGNRTGAVVYDGAGAAVIPARAGRASLIDLLGRLEDRPRAGGGDASLAAALRRVRRLGSRGGLVVVVSDLLDASDWPREMRALGQHRDVVVARLTDPREDDLPPVGLLTLVDPETGRLHEVQTSSKRFRQRYAAAAADRRRAIDDRLRASRASHFELATDADWLRSVVGFVTSRRRQR